MTVQELYQQTITSLPAPERLQLAVLILNDIPPASVSEYSETWGDDDLKEASLHSLARAGESFGDLDSHPQPSEQLEIIQDFDALRMAVLENAPLVQVPVQRAEDARLACFRS